MELYNVSNWGAGFFTINDRGHVEVRPRGEDGPRIDCLELVQDLHQRGLRTPLLIRFSDILASRVRGLCGAFARAIEEYGYQGAYRGVYPIKVDQQLRLASRFQAHPHLGAVLDDLLDDGDALRAAFLLLFFPSSIFLFLPFSEGLFIATLCFGLWAAARGFGLAASEQRLAQQELW